MSTDTTQSRSRFPVSPAVVAGLVIGLFGLPLLWPLDIPARVGTSTAGSMLVGSLTNWLVVAALLVVVLFWEARPLASIGLERPTRRQVAAGLGAGLGAVVLGLLVTGVAVAALDLRQPETLSTVASLPLPVKLFLVGTAVVTEELLYRGYPIERLTELTGSVRVGAAASAVAFLAVHYPAWGLVGAIPQAVFTLVLVGLYVRSRNVVACVVAHAVINVLMVLVLPSFL
jgi:membrane protease YdiL (CAAX protease family)